MIYVASYFNQLIRKVYGGLGEGSCNGLVTTGNVDALHPSGFPKLPAGLPTYRDYDMNRTLDWFRVYLGRYLHEACGLRPEERMARVYGFYDQVIYRTIHGEQSTTNSVALSRM